jgi:HEAT repeat protein/outer membrane protein assembly factor BamB
MYRTLHRCLLLLLLAALALGGGRAALAAEEGDPDEKLLRAQKIATNGPGLLAYLRSRTLDDAEEKKLKALIAQLGSDVFAEREQASAELTRYGHLALRFLEKAAQDSDPEVARRARRCLSTINAGAGVPTTLAALHLIARRKPEGAAAVLLRYLPFAHEAFLEEETIATLSAVAFPGGEASPAVVKALQDALPLRRMAAAQALGRSKNAAVQAGVRKLLADPEVRVRLEAAQALLRGGDREAVPALIALLQQDSLEISVRAEELLYLVAGDKAPDASGGDGSAAARKKRHDAWDAWWKARGDAVDLARINAEGRKLGRVMVAETNEGQKVWEYGPDRKERWKLTGFQWPMDVRMLPNGNVLVADMMEGKHVTEHDPSGKLVWKKESAGSGGAVAAQRLANGNTFIATSDRLFEVSRDGKEIVSHASTVGTITDAVHLGNGTVVLINTRGLLREVTWPGNKEVRSLHLSRAAAQPTDWYRIEPEPGRRFLLASHGDGRAFEIDAAGKVTWEYKVPCAYSATRLANGNVLVATAESRRLLEVNRSGQVVHEEKTKGYTGRVRAR